MFYMRFLVILVLFSNSIFSQNSFPKDYFRSPLNIPLSISGSFGELRTNHFHSGLDFRTNASEGLPVYATAAGFISRIKISTAGYGRVIYIDHPNGFTTVYAHLQKCNPMIQQLLIKEHYDKKKYEIELFFGPDEIPVKKGDLIAYSGNTGSSGGPHLHFEFRDTETEKSINPLFFGLGSEFKDTKPPQVIGLIAYSMDDSSQVFGSSSPVFVNLSLQKDGSYLAEKLLASGTISFGINTYDTSDTSFGKNGIYKLDTYLNGNLYFGYEFDSFSFKETKYINTFIDFPRFQLQKQRFQKLFVKDFYPYSIIKTMKNNGIINVSSNFNLNYKIEVQDFKGNKTTVHIPVCYANLPLSQKKVVQKTPYFLKAKNDNSYLKDDISVFFPENTFYEDFYLNFDVKNNELFLHDDSVAVNDNFTVSFDVTKIPIDKREKMFIANLTKNGKISYSATYKKENLFSTKTKNLGKFFLAKDTIAPKIYKPNFNNGNNLDNQKTLQIYISDDLSGIKEYNAYLNGKWILMEYENKLSKLTHNLSDSMYVSGRNDLKVIVKDNLGNSTTFESYFFKTK
jgi:murein DD-endopeptidase MepM/ murein hydrolase activator NlpD